MKPPSTEEIARVRAELWKHVRGTQTDGVRVEPLGVYAPRQYSRYYGLGACLIGAVLHNAKLEPPIGLPDETVAMAAHELGIDPLYAKALEAGFENWWRASAAPGYAEYYALGHEIRQELFAPSGKVQLTL